MFFELNVHIPSPGHANNATLLSIETQESRQEYSVFRRNVQTCLDNE